MGSWLRHNVLRVLFACSLAWALLGLFMEQIFGWAPDTRRDVIETMLVLAVVTACGLITWAIVRYRPGFMRVPSGVSSAFWLTRSLLVPLWVGFLTAVVCGLLAYAKLRFTGDATNPQYGVSVAWAIVWYPVALAPVLSVIAIRRAAVRRARDASTVRRLEDPNIPTGGVQ
jgi:hypothetical protein